MFTSVTNSPGTRVCLCRTTPQPKSGKVQWFPLPERTDSRDLSIKHTSEGQGKISMCPRGAWRSLPLMSLLFLQWSQLCNRRCWKQTGIDCGVLCTSPAGQEAAPPLSTHISSLHSFAISVEYSKPGKMGTLWERLPFERLKTHTLP